MNKKLAKILRKMAGDESWRISEGYRKFLVEMAVKCQASKNTEASAPLTPNQAKKVMDAQSFYANWEKEKKSEKHLLEKKRQNQLLIKLRNTIRDADYNVKKINIVELDGSFDVCVLSMIYVLVYVSLYISTLDGSFDVVI